MRLPGYYWIHIRVYNAVQVLARVNPCGEQDIKIRISNKPGNLERRANLD